MLEVYHTLNLGAFLTPILQCIVIHVVVYILIDIYKNRKKKDGGHRPFFDNMSKSMLGFTILIIYPHPLL